MPISFHVICVPKRQAVFPARFRAAVAAVSNCSADQTNAAPPAEFETIVFRLLQSRVQRLKVIIFPNETRENHVCDVYGSGNPPYTLQIGLCGRGA